MYFQNGGDDKMSTATSQKTNLNNGGGFTATKIIGLLTTSSDLINIS